ncbi:MAG: hypothetical protein WC958_00870 [Dehalococcoidales bacterium]
MFDGNDENYFRRKAESYIEARETASKELLGARVFRRRGAIEAMRQRYDTMQRFTVEDNALYVARKCQRCVASIDNTNLAAQYRKMEQIAEEKARIKSPPIIRSNPPSMETLRKRFNLEY